MQIDSRPEHNPAHHDWDSPAARLKHLRYLLIRAVSCPVPFVPSRLPIIGGRTAIEILLMFGITALVIGIAAPNAEAAGVIADYVMAACVILGMRHNVLYYLFGISFERAIFIHKGIGLLAIAATICHMFIGLSNTTGLVVLACMIVTAVVYLVKPYSFEFFYYVHIICYCVIAVVVSIHRGGNISGLVAIAWAADLVLRYIIFGRKISAEIIHLPAGVVKIRFDKCFEYEAGQYLFVRIPSIDKVEYHPFSISSSPHETHLSMHVRALGDWSKSLMEKAEHEFKGSQQEIYVEGPYGSPSIDVFGDHYEVLVLVSGGIGVTPLQAMYNHFILQEKAGRKFRKVVFIWSVRDKHLAQTMDSDRMKHRKPVKPTAANVDGEIISIAPSPNAEDDFIDADNMPMEFQPIEIRTSRSRSLSRGNSATSLEAASEAQDIMSTYIFHSQFFLTSIKSEADLRSHGIDPALEPHLKFGRPPMRDLLDQVGTLCTNEGIARVGVCVCGPSDMVNEVSDYCRITQMRPNCDTVRFDCHKEVFDF